MRPQGRPIGAPDGFVGSTPLVDSTTPGPAVADAAHRGHAGRLRAGGRRQLYVLGGAFDTIAVRSFPAVHRQLAVALVAEVGPSDRNRDLDLAITLVDEDGRDLGVKSEGKLRVGAPAGCRPGQAAWCRW